MSWLFSQALVEAYSAGTCSDGVPSAQLNVMLTPQQFWRNDKMMDVSRLSQFGLTCAVLTDDLGADLLTWYRVGFRARTSVRQVEAQASMVSAAVCGEKWHELSVKYDRDSCTWKTAQCLWDEDLPESSVTLPKWGMTRNGALFQHKTLERPISGTGFGYSQEMQAWPTPRAGDGNRNGSKPQEHWNRSFTGNWLRDAVLLYPTPVCVDSGAFFNKSGGKPRPTLGAMAKHNLWPTPTRSDATRGTAQNDGRRGKQLVTAVRYPETMWPTPTVCGNHNRKGLSAKSGDGLATFVRKYPTPKAQDSRHALHDRNKCNLGEVIAGESNGGRLNPDWVEWLMGWPLGWTDLKPLEMAKFQEWQRSHGKY